MHSTLKGLTQATVTIPNHVVNRALDGSMSASRAWREHLELTQTEVAERMGITQSAYAQMEGKATLRKSSREKIAAALGLVPEQLDF
jgi:predicted transcriptional regulator